MKKEHFDSKKYVKALSYMSSNNLKTIMDIQCKKDEVLTKLKENKERVADCNKQIKNIETLNSASYQYMTYFLYVNSQINKLLLKN